jgi:hypothetical protein
MAGSHCPPGWLLLAVGILTAFTNGQNTTTILGLNSSTNANDTSDGASPYGTGFAPDVVIIDTDWDNYYPDIEGSTAPDLNDTDSGLNPADPDPDNSTYSIERRLNLREPLDLRPWAADPRRDSKPFYLRVMPLGASITQGTNSADGNGYRKWLREELRYQGWPVNMVGSKQDGNMRDRVSIHRFQVTTHPLRNSVIRLTVSRPNRTTKATRAGSSAISTARSLGPNG